MARTISIVALCAAVSVIACATQFEAALDEQYVTPCALPDGTRWPAGQVLESALDFGQFAASDTWRYNAAKSASAKWDDAVVNEGPGAQFAPECVETSLAGRLAPTIVQVWAVRPQPQTGIFISGTSHFFYVEQPPFLKSKTPIEVSSASIDKCIPCMLTQPAQTAAVDEVQPNHTLWMNADSQIGDTFVLQGAAYPLRRTRHQQWNQLRNMAEAKPVVAPEYALVDLTLWEFAYSLIPRLAAIGDTPPMLVEQGVPVGSGPAISYFVENSITIAADVWQFAKHTIHGRIISLLRDVDPVPTKRMVASRDALRTHRSITGIIPLANRLKSLTWATRTSGDFEVVSRIAFVHNSQVVAASLTLKGSHSFEPGKKSQSAKDGRIEWVSTGGVSQTVTDISLVEMGSETLKFVSMEAAGVDVPRCIGYRAVVMGPGSSAIMLTTIWESSEGVAEYHVVLKKEDVSSSGGTTFRPHGYEVSAGSTCDPAVSYIGDMDPFVFPYAALTSKGDPCAINVLLGLHIGGIGSQATSAADLSSFQYQFGEVVDVSGSWFASIVSFFIAGPSLGFLSTGQFGQVSGSFMMLFVVSIVKFGPRVFLHYKGVDTAKVREQYTNGGIKKGEPLPMRESKASSMTKEQRAELMKQQMDIIAQMKAEDAAKKKK